MRKEDLLELEIAEVNAALGNFVLNFSEEYKAMEEGPERDSVFVEMEGVQTTITKRTVIAKYPVGPARLSECWWCTSSS